MRADFPGYPPLYCQFPNYLPEPVAGHGLAPIGDKKMRAGSIFEQGRAAAVQVVLDFLSCRRIKGDHSFLISLTQNTNMTAADAAAVHWQVDQFRNPDAGTIEQVQHGVVAQDERRSFLGHGQHLVHLFNGECTRQAAAYFRWIDICHRTDGQLVLGDQEIKKCPQGSQPSGIAA